MKTELAGWLRAQLDEDELAAAQCQEQYWRRVGAYSCEVYVLRRDSSTRTIAWCLNGYGDDDVANALHISRWDPARVLAEVNAKRAILDAHEEARAYYDQEVSAPAGELYGLHTAIRLLALAYADRPGYDDEAWRP